MPIISDVLRSVTSRVSFRPSPTLIDRGFGLIYDVGRDITWLKDANYPKTIGRTNDGQMTWNQAMAWVASLSYRGIRGWRLPSALNHDGSGPCLGHNCSDSEIGHLFLVVRMVDTGVQFTNFQNSAKYWNSTEASPAEAYGWDFFGMRQGTLPKNPSTDSLPGLSTLTGPILAWPVHNGDVSAEILQRIFTFGINSRATVSRVGAQT